MSQKTPHGVIVDGWLAIYSLETQDGYPVVSELRVVPCPPELQRWADRPIDLGNGQIVITDGPMLPDVLAVLDGTTAPGPVPARGLTGRLLRKLAPHDMQARHQEALGLLPERLAQDHAYDPAGAPRRPGRRGRSDYFYASICREYVEACAHGSRRPVADIAEARGESAEYVRDLIHDARSTTRGLLTKAPPGKAGGQLTAKALAVLGEEAGD